VSKVSRIANSRIDHPVDNQDHFASPGIDRREHERLLTIFRVAKLMSGHGESLCIARNLSSGGMMIEVLAQYDISQKVFVSLTENQYLEGRIVWQRDFTIGVQFESEVNVIDVLVKHPVIQSGYMRRAPRMPIRKNAQIRIGSTELPIEICDISQYGAKIKTDHEFGDHELVWVFFDELDPISGALRWRADGYAGIEFFGAISVIRLMQWLRGNAAISGTD
jgi:PilZ domain